MGRYVCGPGLGSRDLLGATLFPPQQVCMVPLPFQAQVPGASFLLASFHLLTAWLTCPPCLLSTGAGATGLWTGRPQVATGCCSTAHALGPAASELTTVIFRAGWRAWGYSQEKV